MMDVGMVEVWPVFWAGVVLALTLLLGFFLQGEVLRWSGFGAWGLVLVVPMLMWGLLADAGPIGRMVGLILGLLLAMKAVVAVYGLRRERLSYGQWMVFAGLWLGMRPGVFTRLGRPQVAGWQRLMCKGAIWAGVGGFLLALSRLVWGGVFLPAPTVLGMMVVLGLLLPGLSLIVHFGVLTMLAGVWRRCGVPVRVLFDAPFRAKGLREFWGHRWNLAFAEMTAIAVYRPVRERWGWRGSVGWIRL